MEEVTDEPLYRDRVCGIDIGKAAMAATIRVPSDKNPARRASETREFATTRRGVLELADWLRCWQVPAVVMEATSDYWKPVFYRLEAGGLECVLADARQVKNLPGRPKRDTTDSQWLASCFERGSVFPLLRVCQIFCARDFFLSGSGCLSGLFYSRYMMCRCPVCVPFLRNRTLRAFRG